MTPVARVLTLMTVLLISVTVTVPTPASAARPNIVVVLTDDQRADG